MWQAALRASVPLLLLQLPLGARATAAPERRLVTGSDNCPDQQPGPPTGCDPSVVDPDASGCFDRYEMAFGIRVYAMADVPEWALTYGINVLKQYLDSDMDGEADDPKLLQALTETDVEKCPFTRLMMQVNGQEVFQCKRHIGIYGCRGELQAQDGKENYLKDGFVGLARWKRLPSITDVGTDGLNGYRMNLLEEFHHTLMSGYASAYPEIFAELGSREEAEQENTQLYQAIKPLQGNCELPYDCVLTNAGCTNYDCSCDGGDCSTNRGAWSCNFKPGTCDGAYHYGHPTFDMLSGAELIYFAYMTLYDFWNQTSTLCNLAKSEWEFCTRDEMVADARTDRLIKLMTDPAALGLNYRFPSGLPDGQYNVSSVTSVTTTVTSVTTTVSSGTGGSTDPDSVSAAGRLGGRGMLLATAAWVLAPLAAF